jgi:hypothetical protein
VNVHEIIESIHKFFPELNPRKLLNQFSNRAHMKVCPDDRVIRRVLPELGPKELTELIRIFWPSRDAAGVVQLICRLFPALNAEKVVGLIREFFPKGLPDVVVGIISGRVSDPGAAQFGGLIY